MDGFEADYSNLFAAGLRGIQARSTDLGRSSSEPHLAISSSIGAGSADRDQDFKPVKGPSVPSSFWKSFLLSTRLWRRPSRFPRAERASPAVPSVTFWNNTASMSPHRQSMPSDVEESSLKLRILDWSLRVSNAVGTLDEEDEYVDPYLFDEVDPVDVPASTKFLLTLPTSLGEQDISPALEQHEHRMSLQTMHMMLPSLPYRSFFSSDDETTWESASDSTSEDESGLDDDWDQFRVEWIDFDGAH